MLKDAVEFCGEVPAMQPRNRIHDSRLLAIVGRFEGVLGTVASLIAEELVVYFAGVGDVALRFTAADYTAPNDGRVDF
jgi:hypothetical protein